MIETAVGTGEAGYSGDGGPAREARLNQPFHCCQDGSGNLYVADALNHCVRRVDARTGAIETYAGNGEPGYSGDGGPAARAGLVEPNAIDFDPAGDLYIADVRDCRIRRVARASGMIETVCGTGRRESRGDGGPAAAASIGGARGVAFDRVGNMFVCEREGGRVRRVARDRTIAAYAGTGERGCAGDAGQAAAAVFDRPKWIHVDPDGALYVVATENHRVRRIDPATGLIRTVAGGQRGPDGDGGPPEQAGMDRPHGCWLDASGRLYTADSENHRVRVSWSIPPTP